MKPYFFSALLFLYAVTPASTLTAQSPVKTPRWMSGKGYWVIESNIKTPRESVVYFYNNNDEMIHRKAVSGKRLNPARKAVCKRLEAVLVQSVTAWEVKKPKNESVDSILTKR